jgi:hypothetical protein
LFLNQRIEVWHRRGEAASAAALYSVYSGLHGEAVVSSIASAVALADVGRFREAIEYVQRAAKTLYEATKEVFEQVKVTVQRFVELFVEAFARALAWVDEHKAYLFLMAAVALSVALDMWGLVEMEKLVHAASAPFVAGLADAGERAAERFKALGERYTKWKVDENAIDGVLKAPLSGERPYTAFLKLAESASMPKPLAELRKALTSVEGGAERDAAVVAALVLYKALVKNAGAYGEWTELFEWARGLVEKQEFTVTAGDIEKLRETQRRLEETAEEVRRELNSVLALYSQSGFYKEAELLNELKKHLKVDVKKAEELARARNKELSEFGSVNMGTRAYAALLSAARGGIYGHLATLLMVEGVLADLVLSTPRTAYEKAWKIVRRRGEVVDPSRLRVEAAGLDDRVASALLRFLIGYGEADPRLSSGAGEVDLKFRRVERGGKKDDEKRRVVKGVERGFQVFRAYGGVEAPVGELWIGDVAYFKVSKEELRRLVEEARKTAPDLSGFDKAPQYLEWRATDVTTSGGQIVGTTVHSWQLRWYFGLLGEEKSFRGSASVTKESINFVITARWPREREDQILKKSRWLESLLGRPVKSWRELVDAIDWRWVVEKVGGLADELKPWIGRKKMSDVGREGLMRRMLGELELLAHFAETRRGKDDGRWREERAKRLSKVVAALSGGRIAGEYAERLAKLIILYAERREERAKKRIDKLAEELAGVSKEEVWGVVQFVLSDMYCLARDCARDEVMRKFVAPVLELIMLDKALRAGFDRGEALLYFGEMYATAVAGDGTVGPREIRLAVGGELGGGAALLRLAALHLLNQLMPDKLKFNVRIYMGEGRYYIIAASGENAARFMRLLAVSAPSAGGGYISEKFNEFMKEARVEVRPGDVRRTKSGRVAADLTVSEAGIAVKYNVYLRNKIVLEFHSTDRSRVELAARLLKLAGVSAEVKKKVGGKDDWYVKAATDRLTAGHKELRDALAEIVKTTVKNGWVDASKAERWLEKLERGRTLREGWPKYLVRLVEGALVVRFSSPNPDGIEREVQRLREMGLEEGRHFSVKMPEGDKRGYVLILKDGLERAAWLSLHGSGEQQRLAAEFVEYILQRARDEGEDVHRKALEVVEEGKARGFLTLKGLERKVEVGATEHVVKIIDGGTEFDEGRSGKKLLRIRITAEVDGIKGDYTITYGRYGKLNATLGYAAASAKAPGGREADAERLSALVKALTGNEPRIIERSDGTIVVVCGREHLDGFMRYTELAETIARWLEETKR